MAEKGNRPITFSGGTKSQPKKSAPGRLGVRRPTAAMFNLGKPRRATEPLPSLSETWTYQSRGSRPGQLRDPRYLCFKSGVQEIVVSDRKNHSVQVYNPDLDQVRMICKQVTPCLERPTGVCLTSDEEKIAVADHGYVHFIDDNCRCSGCWKTVDEEISSISGLCMDADDNLIISNLGAKPTVDIYTPSGKRLRSLRANFQHPQYIACNNALELIYVSDSNAGVVHIFDKSSKSAICTFDGLDKKKGGRKLVYPVGLAVGMDGCVYVADRGATKVSVFTDSGQFMYDVLTEKDGLRDPLSVAASRNYDRLAVVEQVLEYGHRDKVAVKLFDVRREG